jgi:hypothetical protein
MEHCLVKQQTLFYLSTENTHTTNRETTPSIIDIPKKTVLCLRQRS